jgi:hypothetical protein
MDGKPFSTSAPKGDQLISENPDFSNTFSDDINL